MLELENQKLKNVIKKRYFLAHFYLLFYIFSSLADFCPLAFLFCGRGLRFCWYWHPRIVTRPRIFLFLCNAWGFTGAVAVPVVSFWWMFMNTVRRLSVLLDVLQITDFFRFRSYTWLDGPILRRFEVCMCFRLLIIIEMILRASPGLPGGGLVVSLSLSLRYISGGSKHELSINASLIWLKKKQKNGVNLTNRAACESDK